MIPFPFRFFRRSERAPHTPGILYLHIGLPKTGTTFLQLACARNRSRLLKLGICYPEVDTHVKAPFQHVSLVRAIETGNSAAVTELLAAAFRTAGHVLLSAEYFGQALRGRGQPLIRWFDAVRSEGHVIKAIVYLRRQDLQAQSTYRAGVRNPDGKRLTLTFREYIGERVNRFDYWEKFEPWQEAVGKENLMIRPFEKNQWPRGELLADFMSTLGIDGHARIRAPRTEANRGFSAAVTELLRRSNARRDSRQQRQVLQLLHDILPPELLYGEAGRHAYMRPIEQRAFVDKFAESNRRVAIEWLGRPDGQLFYDEIEPDAAGQCADLSDAVITELRNEIAGRLAKPPRGCKFRKDDAARLGLID